MNKNKKVISYSNSISNKVKIFIGITCFLALLFLTILFATMSLSITEEKKINYSENSDIDYRVYLRENDFYEENYLGKNKIYVASLIDKIEVTFNYIFKIDTKSDVDFNYDVIATLVIADSTGKNVFFEKDYPLIENAENKIVQGTINNVKKTVNIDYNYYNNLANKFKINYGINTTSTLIVKMKVRESSDKHNMNFNNNSEMLLSIPLSEKEVNITMDYNEVKNNGKIISNKTIEINNYVYLYFVIITSIICICSFIILIKLLLKTSKKRSQYDKYVSKILKEYDRLIVNTTTKPDVNNKKVIKIDSFNELLDVRDNLKLPIKYYVVTEHSESNMYIDHEEELYLLVLKEKKNK